MEQTLKLNDEELKTNKIHEKAYVTNNTNSKPYQQ